MKTRIEITLPVVAYDHNVAELAAYLQMVGSELTKAQTFVAINDYDFTEKMSIFKNMRKPSIFNRRSGGMLGTGNAGTSSSIFNSNRNNLYNRQATSNTSIGETLNSSMNSILNNVASGIGR